MGDYPTAFRYLAGSVELARGCGDQHQPAWSLSILARAHLLRDQRSQAAAAGIDHPALTPLLDGARSGA